ncbi:response regulator transcription factor [Natranaerobius thermophilus]|uniref:Stage 0 sporulation protein A homolog n=1 Tax=Natranaerobius thermophilus (strain ATCC BAA-1301 / DSM 18059 / JW/NM-WN-LF) TaxID=457570 RepID=B2A8D5_NATTJ|nr:response regulator transcription factor [Natranaerobius thermophilus]ACB84501.1 two component transcriptional regulator, winged helix family [Natranaerobius thermophilus JW/NM-WN-LF]
MSENTNCYTVLIIEDEQGLVKVLKAYLEKEGYQVYASHDGLAGLELFKKQNPDIVVLDLMLPNMSGEEIARKIRKEQETPILMLTAKGSEDEKITGLGIGADDYVVKPASPREIIARLKTILRRVGKEPGRIQQEIITAGEITIDTLAKKIYLRGTEISLTQTEFDILSTLALYPKKVFSRENLADRIYGYLWEGDSRTIDTHIKNLRRKIEQNPKKPIFIKTVFGAGYQFGKF